MNNKITRSILLVIAVLIFLIAVILQSQVLGMGGFVLFGLVVVLSTKSKKEKNTNDSNESKKTDVKETKFRENDAFDALMTGQLVAFYKTTHENKYSNEYERRLKHIGFTENEAKNLFMLELMMLKYDSISILTDKKYLTNNYFDLKTVKFPMEASYYAEHQTFLVSEVTKIWDEAEYIWANYRNSEMPKEVLAEIFQISRYGGGELLIKTIEGISKSSSISKDKILKYSNKEQDLIFKYKWNKEANESHPYH